jgi:hypothetical protein
MKHPEMVSQYQIVAQLGAGGVGEVYSGIDPRLHLS